MKKTILENLESLRWPSGWFPEKRHFISQLEQEAITELYKELVARVLSKKSISRSEKDTLRALEEKIPSTDFHTVSTVEHEEWIFLDGKNIKWHSNVRVLIDTESSQ